MDASDSSETFSDLKYLSNKIPRLTLNISHNTLF